jgi:hypothetical protein
MGCGVDMTEKEQEILDALPGRDWWRPMDLGGHDGSHHSGTLRRLVKKGLVKRRRRGTLMNMLGSHRGSWEYSRATGR